MYKTRYLIIYLALCLFNTTLFCWAFCYLKRWYFDCVEISMLDFMDKMYTLLPHEWVFWFVCFGVFICLSLLFCCCFCLLGGECSLDSSSDWSLKTGLVLLLLCELTETWKQGIIEVAQCFWSSKALSLCAFISTWFIFEGREGWLPHVRKHPWVSSSARDVSTLWAEEFALWILP